MSIERIAVVGAGKMGNGIALNAAMAGFDVVLQNRTAANLDKARDSIEKQVRRLTEKGKLTEDAAAATLARIRMTSTFETFETIDFVIEVVAENLDIKNDMFRKLDEICKPEAVLVSSTSTFSITTLAAATRRSDRVAGMHFFLPPSKLVEITRGYYTSDETMAAAREVADRMEKLSVEVRKDSPGFIANRIYTPLFLEAFKAYDEGLAALEEIDQAMKSTYLPVGPFELADIIGLDVILSSLEYYEREFGPQWRAPQCLRLLVRAGRLGKKTGAGFFNYT